MTTQTDPAREIAELCVSLRSGNLKQRGHTFLAQAFDVAPWSGEFYQIIFTIIQRADDLCEMIQQLDLDEDLRTQASGHLSRIKLAFSENGLNNEWQHACTNFISPEHVNPITMLSSVIRSVQCYPKLNAQEQQEITTLVDELLVWLREHQLIDQDFVRCAIIEALEQFRFRLIRIGWLGWGYTLQSLREVLGAYLALERGTPEPDSDPQAKALLIKMSGAIKAIYRKVGFAKELGERANFVVEVYKWSSALILTAKAGFLLLTVSNG